MKFEVKNWQTIILPRLSKIRICVALPLVQTKISVTFRQVRQFYWPESLRLFFGRRLPSNLGYTTTPAFWIKMKKKNIQLKGNVKWRTHSWRELFQDKINTQTKYSGQVGRVPVLSLWHLFLCNSKMPRKWMKICLRSIKSSMSQLTLFQF